MKNYFLLHRSLIAKIEPGAGVFRVQVGIKRFVNIFLESFGSEIARGDPYINVM